MNRVKILLSAESSKRFFEQERRSKFISSFITTLLVILAFIASLLYAVPMEKFLINKRLSDTEIILWKTGMIVQVLFFVVAIFIYSYFIYLIKFFKVRK